MVMHNPKVSVIVPVYNVEEYLRQCLDSLVHQTLDDLEIIVVDDGSTDGSLSIARQYAEKHANLRVISQGNQGLSGARNTGMKHAAGEYVGFLDSDDWAGLDMFQSLYERAVEDRAELVIADAKVVREDLRTVDAFFDRAAWDELPVRYKNGPFRINEEPRALLLEPAAWKRLYKRSFLDRLSFQFASGLIFEDVPAHFQLLLAADAISLLDKPVCFYRMGRPGKITARRDRSVFQVFDIFDLCKARCGRRRPTSLFGPCMSRSRCGSVRGCSGRSVRMIVRTFSPAGQPNCVGSPRRRSFGTHVNFPPCGSVLRRFACEKAGSCP